MIISMGFMTSDLITTLISHGGLTGIFMLLVHVILVKRIS